MGGRDAMTTRATDYEHVCGPAAKTGYHVTGHDFGPAATTKRGGMNWRVVSTVEVTGGQVCVLGGLVHCPWCGDKLTVEVTP